MTIEELKQLIERARAGTATRAEIRQADADIAGQVKELTALALQLQQINRALLSHTGIPGAPRK